MAEVIKMPVDSPVDSRGRDRKDKSSGDDPHSSPPPPLPPPRRRDNRDFDRQPNRRGGEYYDRNRSPLPLREREKGYKWRSSLSPPPVPYRDRRHSPPPRRSPPYKRFRREDGGYEGRRGSPTGGFGPGDRRFGYDYVGGYEREMGGRPAFSEERLHGRYISRAGGYPGGPADWDSGRGSYGDVSSIGSNQREGLMSYKQFIQELEDDILPAEAERRYQEYRSEYISTQKRVFFEAHKDEEWLRDKYHPTNLLAVIERWNELARKVAKEFLLDLQSGTLDLGPGLNTLSPNKSGQTSDPNSDDEVDASGKRRRHGRAPAKETDLLSTAPKAHPISSEPRRIQVDIEQAQTLVFKLDSEKGINDNILGGPENDKMSREKSHGSSTGPVIIVRGLASVKGLEGVELLDTLITYLWRVHGLDYYGMIETNEAKGVRHVRGEGRSSDVNNGGSEWEKKLDSHWQERLKGQDPLEVMTAKEKIDAAAVEALEPYVRKIRDEKYGWKYGCGAKGCTKLFHAAEFVNKHLKLKHPDLVMELTSKVREELYFQNYMTDENAPGGTPVMQQPTLRDKPLRRQLGPDNRLKDDRNHRERGSRANGGERYDRLENPQSGDLQHSDGPDGGNQGEPMIDVLGVPPNMATPVLMPVPGAGPLGPFVPAPPEVALHIFRDQPFEGGGRNGRAGPPLSGGAPVLLSSGSRQDPRRLRSYQDLDAPEHEVTVVDYRSF
ncbi:hypothetical protein K2173_013800 [Erythroxylum novogranatense]|uniref:C2H2-type domain-containing protein n=1 Tax=Erythroxylum novogranatense TaxID=1862640 RepID=A0AAV8SCX0_9ROSI|nr:hypothetical protein K2173_013800 [Erythroxylum novogranatense]